MTRVLLVQHLPHEHEGVLGEVLEAAGAAVERVRAWRDPVPTDVPPVDALIVLGGDMNTDQGERWPHLHAVRELLAVTVAADLPVLGICLGAQLLAEATGGSVFHGVPEIGWPAIRRTAAGARDPVLTAVPDGTEFFNAHGDHIIAPVGSAVLATSEGCTVHAFRVRRALGLQYHAEIDASYVAGYVAADGVEDYLGENGWTPDALVAEARRRNGEHRAAGLRLFGAWLDDIS